MTLRRFVRTTIDNFRQLLQSISAPTTSLPMPPIVPPAPQNAAPQPAIGAPALPNAARQQANTIAGNNAPTPQAFTAAGDAADADAAEAGGHNHDVQEDADGDETVAAPVGAAEVKVEEVSAEALDATEASVDEHNPGGASAEGEHDATPAAVLPLAAALESLLFVADAAVEPAQLARALAITAAEAEAALLELDAGYRQQSRGLRLQVRNGRYQLVTAPEAASLIENFLNLDASARLSSPALEALAVVAYRQPVTRAQIEAVRGVDCSGVLRSLLGRGLLEEVGRLDAPGRPVLYGVTDLFMHHFGLTALHELPPLEDAELARIEEVGA